MSVNSSLYPFNIAEQLKQWDLMSFHVCLVRDFQEQTHQSIVSLRVYLAL